MVEAANESLVPLKTLFKDIVGGILLWKRNPPKILSEELQDLETGGNPQKGYTQLFEWKKLEKMNQIDFDLLSGRGWLER